MKQTELHPPDMDSPVAALSRPDFVRLLATETAGEALVRLRGERVGERVVYFYVTGEDGRLVGVVPVRRLLLADEGTPVGSLMVQPVESVPAGATLGEALRIFNRRRLLALPVVDDQGRLTGVLDLVNYSGEAIDFERHEAAQNLFQLVGIHVEQEEAGGVWAAFRRRFLWLPASVAGGLAAALLTGAFDHLLREVVVLAFFIPVVLAVPESVAMQSVTIGLHRMQLSALRLSRGGGGVGRELAIGGLLGLAAGFVAGSVAWLWLKASAVGAIVAAAIWAGSSAGAIIGLAVPRSVHRARLDPAVSSGPAVLALTDVVTLAAYLALASRFLER